MSSVDELYSGQSFRVFFGSGDRMQTLLFRLGILFGSGPEPTKLNLGHCYAHVIYIAEHPDDRVAKEEFAAIFENNSVWKLLLKKDPVGFFLASMMLPPFEAANERHQRRLLLLRRTREVLAGSP